MGLKKIAEMRAELRKKTDVLDQFMRLAKQYNETYAKIAASYEGLEKLRTENLAKVVALNTMGIKEFEDYKKSLVFVFAGMGSRPLPTKPLEDVVNLQHDAVDAEVKERIAKLAASMPAEVKPGMVFRFDPSGVLWEITSGPEKSKNVNLHGDDQIWYKYNAENGGSLSTNLTTLKKNCKFIKT